jgi:hypothetical protein
MKKTIKPEFNPEGARICLFCRREIIQGSPKRVFCTPLCNRKFNRSRQIQICEDPFGQIVEVYRPDGKAFRKLNRKDYSIVRSQFGAFVRLRRAAK